MKDDDCVAKIEEATAGQPEPDFDLLARCLDDKRVAMLQYAVKLTRCPASTVKADVAQLRATGFCDTDILHIAEVVGYFAYANRIADGLGVLLES